MYQEIERFTEDRSAAYQERRMLRIEQMLDREIDHETGRDTALKSLFRQWRDGQSRDRLPLADMFDPRERLTKEQRCWVSWVDASPDNPLKFVLHDHPAKLFGNFSRMTLGDHPYKFHAIRCAFEYDQCKRIQQPTYHEISQRIGGYFRSYVRLIVPTANRAGKITKLFYATRYLTEPIAE